MTITALLRSIHIPTLLKIGTSAQTTAFNEGPNATKQSSGIVGVGAAAVVRKGVWKGKDVAVKVYHPGYDTQEFVKEVSTLSSLAHPAMVKLFGICVDSGRFGLVMECVLLLNSSGQRYSDPFQLIKQICSSW